MPVKESYDYIIVGLGAAGSIVASRLAELEGVSILAIEAGDNFSDNPNVYTPFKALSLWNNPNYTPPYNPPYDEWSFQTAPQAGGAVYSYPRGVQWGGSASHNGMVSLRGDPEPYNEWSKVTGDASWGYDALLPYFKKMEHNKNLNTDDKWHGRDGWLSLTNVPAETVQLDLIAACEKRMPFVRDFNGNPDKIAGVGYFDASINCGTRSDSSVSLLIPTLKSKRGDRIKILSNTLVLQLVWSKTIPNKISGVKFQKGPNNYKADTQFRPSNNPVYKVYAKKEVILCGGAINTPQLLMLSGIGPKAHLQKHNIEVIKDLQGVGSNLQDHMEFAVIHEIDKPYSFQTLGAETNQQIYDTGRIGPYASNGIAVGFDWYSGIEPNQKVTDLHVHSFATYFRDFELPDWIPTVNPNKTYHTSLIEISNPKARGCLTLRSNNPHDQPIIDEQLYSSEHDLLTMALGVKLVRSIWTEKEMQKYNPREIYPGTKYESIQQIETFAATKSAYGHHICGTCSMGKKKDPWAVVDNKLRVIGVKGLRIVDASIFPRIPTTNPTLAVYVVAEKGADLIKKDYK